MRDGKRAMSDAVFSAANRQRNRHVLAGAGGTQRDYIKQLFIRGDNIVSVSAFKPNMRRSPTMPR